MQSARVGQDEEAAGGFAKSKLGDKGRYVPDGQDGDIVTCLGASGVVVEDHKSGEGWGLG